MRVFAFLGGSHARRPGYRERLAALEPELVFDDMRDLPSLVEKAAGTPMDPRPLDGGGLGWG